MSDNLTLRRYPHPGKFEGGLVIDEIAYQATLDGADDKAGDCQEFGEWYGLVRGPVRESLEWHGLTDAELTHLLNTAGAIVREDDQGFVDVAWYDSADELESDWQGISEIFAADDRAMNEIDG